jgi:hypothetical protein
MAAPIVGTRSPSVQRLAVTLHRLSVALFDLHDSWLFEDRADSDDPEESARFVVAHAFSFPYAARRVREVATPDVASAIIPPAGQTGQQWLLDILDALEETENAARFAGSVSPFPERSLSPEIEASRAKLRAGLDSLPEKAVFFRHAAERLRNQVRLGRGNRVSADVEVGKIVAEGHDYPAESQLAMLELPASDRLRQIEMVDAPQRLRELAAEICSLPARGDSDAERYESAGRLLLAAIELGAFSGPEHVVFVEMIRQRAAQRPPINGFISAFTESVWRLLGKPKTRADGEPGVVVTDGRTFEGECQLVADAIESEASRLLPKGRNEVRDRWCYDRAIEGEVWKSIASQIPKQDSQWEPVTPQRIRQIVDEYADRHNLPRIPKRRGGTPTK